MATDSVLKVVTQSAPAKPAPAPAAAAPVHAVRPAGEPPAIVVPAHMASMVGARAPLADRQANPLFDGPGAELQTGRAKLERLRNLLRPLLQQANAAAEGIDTLLKDAAGDATLRDLMRLEGMDAEQLKALRSECAELVESYKPRLPAAPPVPEPAA